MKSLGELLIRYPFMNAVAQSSGIGVLVVWPEGAEEEAGEKFAPEVAAGLMADAAATLHPEDEYQLGQITYGKNPRIKGSGWLRLEEKKAA